MSRKLVISFLVLSVVLSGCTHEKISALFDTNQAQKEKTWQVQGNTYSTIITYEIPEGEEKNLLTIVLEDGVIKDVQIGITSQDKTSIRYQTKFADELKPLIIGKKLEDIQAFDRISGATYTTQAFDKALAALKQERS